MNNNDRAWPRATLPLVRCAVYTRKSTEEGLEQEFNSLDAQRESAEAYVRSQAGLGWSLLPERYDDGGFTGGNTDRPALQRLMADVQASKVDCVIVYKVDRLSRSLLDFARLMETFEQHKVSFVSVTQLFSTATSMGRLILNVLLSFAQFEREIIAERTRDKIAATRRKGKWAGGRPLLGFDVDPRGGRLLVNPDEAERVRAIFALYLEHGALLPVVQELERRGWANKCWQTKKGQRRGGRPFTKTGLHRLLTNVAYVGRVRYKDEVHPGEQPPLVDAGAFQRVGQVLASHGPTLGPPALSRPGALLKGLLRCGPCGCAMTPAHCAKGARRYRYYTCVAAQKRGWHTCPSKSIPAAEIEALVVAQVQEVGRDPALLRSVLEQARQQGQGQMAELEAEGHALEHDLTRWQGELHLLSGQLRPGEDNGTLVARLAELQERVALVAGRVQKVRAQLRAVHDGLLDEGQAAAALALFEPLWQGLSPGEQARVLGLLVRRVDYDGARGQVAITFHPAGIQALADELAGREEGAQRMTTTLTIEREVHFQAQARGRKELRVGPAPQGPPPDPGRVPRVSRLMALALRFEGLLKAGVVKDYAELARLGHVSRARVSQVMNLLSLAPDLQEAVLFLPRTLQGRDPIPLWRLQPIASTLAWRQQRRLWAGLFGR